MPLIIIPVKLESPLHVFLVNWASQNKERGGATLSLTDTRHGMRITLGGVQWASVETGDETAEWKLFYRTIVEEPL